MRTKLDILNDIHNGVDRMPTMWKGSIGNEERSDKYAENLIGSGHYKDIGCDLAPACFNCPYSECMKTINNIDHREQRNASMWRDYKLMKKNGASVIVKILAEKYKVGTRTVHRIINDAKKGQGLAFNTNVPVRSMNTHKLLTKGIYKQRAPLPEYLPSY